MFQTNHFKPKKQQESTLKSIHSSFEGQSLLSLKGLEAPSWTKVLIYKFTGLKVEYSENVNS